MALRQGGGGRGGAWRQGDQLEDCCSEPVGGGTRKQTGAVERCFLPSIYRLGGQAAGDEGEQRGGMPLSSQLGGVTQVLLREMRGQS